nr:MAG TPA: transferase [Caudoviricetes sp.]
MPTITGDLRLITNQPAAVTALQIHAPAALRRPHHAHHHR